MAPDPGMGAIVTHRVLKQSFDKIGMRRWLLRMLTRRFDKMIT